MLAFTDAACIPEKFFGNYNSPRSGTDGDVEIAKAAIRTFPPHDDDYDLMLTFLSGAHRDISFGCEQNTGWSPFAAHIDTSHMLSRDHTGPDIVSILATQRALGSNFLLKFQEGVHSLITIFTIRFYNFWGISSRNGSGDDPGQDSFAVP
ncbi:hypothetical protein [Edaphobacter aggregans]|uniref:hypothetical protein n=1 Tax=Edaphobacter aggregans TaxID=570835 RepID=UPI00054D1F37|nr:hypothetical protein [Edaphobacter aggregans]